MPHFPNPEAKRIPFLPGTEEARLFVMPEEKLVERRFKKEKDGLGEQTGFCEPLERFWTHKFVHTLFPQFSIDVTGLKVAANRRERSKMYSQFVPDQESHQEELKGVYQKIAEAHKRRKEAATEEEKDRIFDETRAKHVTPFDNRITEAYFHQLNASLDTLAKYGISVKHPQINVIVAKEPQEGSNFVYTEFLIDYKKAKRVLTSEYESLVAELQNDANTISKENRNKLLERKGNIERALVALERSKGYKEISRGEKDFLHSMEQCKRRDSILMNSKEAKNLVKDIYRFLEFARERYVFKKQEVTDPNRMTVIFNQVVGFLKKMPHAEEIFINAQTENFDEVKYKIISRILQLCPEVFEEVAYAEQPHKDKLLFLRMIDERYNKIVDTHRDFKVCYGSGKVEGEESPPDAVLFARLCRMLLTFLITAGSLAHHFSRKGYYSAMDINFDEIEKEQIERDEGTRMLGVSDEL